MPTDLDVGGRGVRVHLLDLSATGALCYARTPPPEGTAVKLACGGTFRHARVAWVAGPRFGLSFDRALTSVQLDAVLLLQEAMIADAVRRIDPAPPASTAPTAPTAMCV